MSATPPDSHRSDVAAWCELLGLVQDEAKSAEENFLAYLTSVALSHASTLRRKPQVDPPTLRLVDGDE